MTKCRSSSSPGILLRLCVEPDQRFSAHVIALSEQLCNVDIEWTVGLCAGQELVYACHCCCNRICRCPIRFEEIKADLAGLEINVWVADGCDKANGGRRVGICGGNVDIEQPCAACGA